MFSTTSLSVFGLAMLSFANAAVHDITVGGADLKFSPEAIFAQPGDQVVFHFQPKNHTATQSSFADPCGPKAGGLDSGFMAVAANASSPTWTVTVNDTTPTWFYCRQAAKTPASHCGSGMVFAINCGQDGAPNSFTNFKASALAVGAALKAAASTTATAAYGGVTIPPAPQGADVTQTVTLQSSTWTTSYSSYPGSPAPTPAALAGTVHTVMVGGPGGLVFNPSTINAAPRDTIVFQFQDKNHTVTQSAFADPCRKLTAADGTPNGFDSGFMPVAAGSTPLPTWNLTINDTTPIWAYCRQKTPASHCGSGMVLAINSVESSPRNFAAFQALAKQLNGTAASDTAGNTTTAPPPADSGAVTATSSLGALLLAMGGVFASMILL